ncbi:hypothetical protein TSACC_2787 [Terrimicrobium sacchariphilum]|uniref:Uncharacterized protein n=1 Tax=Terrimicrobium sacchariphilum TaxID=690879 RepID=A0A146G3I7_TERSA|nr:DUF6714 family protein [Terrimicrobium sacchariphilum]GAT32389.1 hypothetical protein TSACC_2787 [Terrimicrobium sacchariphilum]
MKTDAEAIFEVEQAFASCQRPQRFTDYWLCDECAEHNETLARHTPQTITLKELGNVGWDPICFATPEAFQYYLPALSRLAIAEIEGNYLMQFLFHVNDDRRYQCLSASQRRCLFRFLSHISEAYPEYTKAHFIEDDLAAALLKYKGSE